KRRDPAPPKGARECSPMKQESPAIPKVSGESVNKLHKVGFVAIRNRIRLTNGTASHRTAILNLK
ncbi:MAG: hypothetical protein BRC33_13690, partial [Cyanobacteria bacterium SW_9_44_58]